MAHIQNAKPARAGLHETFEREEQAAGSSDRGFGLVFTGFFAIVAIVRWWKDHGGAGWFAAAAAIMTILADDKLSIRRTITRQWWKAQRLHFQARRRAAHAARQAKPA